MARGRPIVVEWAANVRDFLKGTKQVERSVEDVADELQDATKDADRFEDRFTDAMRDAERQADQSARRIEDDFAQAPGKLGEFGADAGQEFVQNMGESVSSGDIENLAQDVGGGLLSALPLPLGIAAGAVGGVIIGAFTKVKEEQERILELTKERTETFYDAMLAGFEEFGAAWTQSQINQEMERIAREEPQRLAEIEELAGRIGLDYLTILEAIAGNVDKQAEVNAALDEAEEKNTRIEEAQGRQKDITDEIATAIDRDVKGAIDGLREEIDTSNAGLETGLDYLNNYEEVINRINGTTVNVNVRATAADAFTEYIFNGTGP